MYCYYSKGHYNNLLLITYYLLHVRHVYCYYSKDHYNNLLLITYYLLHVRHVYCYYSKGHYNNLSCFRPYDNVTFHSTLIYLDYEVVYGSGHRPPIFPIKLNYFYCM